MTYEAIQADRLVKITGDSAKYLSIDRDNGRCW